MNHRIPITIRLNSFEGPLDLLLYLIQAHEMDISKVSIEKITDQYLAYVRLLQELDFDAASEFLVMAATLLHWKSKALLPVDENERRGRGPGSEDDLPLTQEELVEQLKQHQLFLKAGESLGSLPILGRDVFSRANSKPPVEKVWKEMNVTDLVVGYQEMLARARKRTHILQKETVSIGDKILELADRLPLNELVEFSRLLSIVPSRPEIVATFLASLELARLKKMHLHQETTYATIYVELIEAISNLDMKLVAEFNSMAPASEALPA